MAKTKTPPKDKANGTPRKPRQRQGYLTPELEPPHVQEIDDAAEDYATARDARMRMGEQEQDTQQTLLALMKKHKLKQYEFNGRIVTVEELEKVKVRRAKPEANGDE